MSAFSDFVMRDVFQHNVRPLPVILKHVQDVDIGVLSQ